VVAEKYRFAPDHEIVSPEIVPKAPETVAVQELVEPTSIVEEEQTTEVLVVAAALTVTELVATWAGEVNDIWTQCMPSPRLLAEKVTAATLPELSDETNWPNGESPLQLPEVSAKTTTAPKRLLGLNPVPETWNEDAGPTRLGVTVILWAYTYLTLTKTNTIVNTNRIITGALPIRPLDPPLKAKLQEVLPRNYKASTYKRFAML
jgi:hypothetical protein